MTVAQTLRVVHGLVGNVRVVMEGAQCLHVWLLIFYWTLVASDGKASTDSTRRDLGMCLTKRAYLCSNVVVLAALHEMLSEMNKMKRLLFLYPKFRCEKPMAHFRYSAAKGRPTLALPSRPVDEPRLCLECTP
jgi:hypothetical protein